VRRAYEARAGGLYQQLRHLYEVRKMIRWIIGILLVMVLAAIVGADCLTCGQGDSIRSNIKELFNNKPVGPERMQDKRP
jgi:hypothetical protein